MQSNIARELNPKFNPIVLIKSNEIPDGATGPETPIGGCSMAYLAKTVVDRTTTYFTKNNATCAGIASGLGWNEGINDVLLDFQSCFLSLGEKSARDPEKYVQMLGAKSQRVKEMFKKGERFYMDYDTARENIQKRPEYNNGDVAIFKAIENVDESDEVLSVIFVVNAIELAALIQLDGSHRKDNAYILTPQASACQALGCHTFNQADTKNPRPVLGFIDIAARKYLNGISNEYLSFSVPWKLFLKLEDLSRDSVFQSTLWQNMTK